jgi:rsbT co-antagonist protein RsbR
MPNRDDAQRELEERVEELTQELAVANAALKAHGDELAWAQQVIVEQTREIGELSSPVIELWDALLVVPVVGELSDSSVAALTGRVLRRVAEARAAAVLLDVTGVADINAATAQRLLGAARAVRLLGAAVILTGVRPAIAQALVSLGVDLGDLEIRATLADGLREAFARRGLSVVARRPPC